MIKYHLYQSLLEISSLDYKTLSDGCTIERHLNISSTNTPQIHPQSISFTAL